MVPKLKAVIFDLDGTILDNEDIYARAFCAVLKKRGISCEEVKHTSGIGVKENWVRMKAELGLPDDPDALTAETQKFYLDHLSEVKIRPGFHKLVFFLRSNGIKVLLSTSNIQEIGELVLNTRKIANLFDNKTFGDEVPRKKPAPDLFLAAIQKEELLPTEVLIIEDSPSGIAAGRAANAKTWVIKTDRFTREEVTRAQHVFQNFAELSALIKDLLQ